MRNETIEKFEALAICYESLFLDTYAVSLESGVNVQFTAIIKHSPAGFRIYTNRFLLWHSSDEKNYVEILQQNTLERTTNISDKISVEILELLYKEAQGNFLREKIINLKKTIAETREQITKL